MSKIVDPKARDQETGSFEDPEKAMLMTDHGTRAIHYLRVSVTDRCNLRCTYCMPKEGVLALGHHDILRYEEILRVIHAAMKAGVVKVRVTGGEPLIRKGILKFLSSLGSIQGLQDISLTTNGILLEAMAEDIFQAGIRRVNVSLDSLNPGKYEAVTRGGDLRKVLRGIEQADRIGFSPIKINTVAIRGFNDDEILEFARLALEKPYQVRFIELMPLGSAALDHGTKFIAGEDLIARIRQYYALEALEAGRDKWDGPARLFKMKNAAGKIGVISAVSQHFCRTCNRLRLTADGHLRACLLRDGEVDVKGPIRSGCSDDELGLLIDEVIRMKGKGFRETAKGVTVWKCSKAMSAIGG